MLSQRDILDLIEKFQSGKISKEEKYLLDEWYHSFNDDSQVELDINESRLDFKNRLKQKIQDSIDSSVPEIRSVRKWKAWYTPAVAATLIAIFTTSYFLILLNPSKKQLTASATVKPANVVDAAPGSNKAILTLTDGSIVVLDNASNGVIRQQGGVKIQKLHSGLLAYAVDGAKNVSKADIEYNTIATPRGGQYQITLSDGTKVWLNAASSIHFPVAFVGNERRVEITGEAYFEVAKNKAMPFKVKAASAEVEVLGTHFNINAYDDESFIKTTLLEGSVKVSAANTGNNYKILSPGQQASISASAAIAVNNNIDMEEVMAWKNGLFLYNGTDIHAVLRQLSKWYDVDIEYRGNVKAHFTGQLKRELFASKVLDKIALTGEVHFTIEGKKIIVSP
jgi:ferric-dicitrate binding protein FerR (iron transport regulator)